MKTVLFAILCLGSPGAQEGLDKKVAEIVARLADDAIDAREQAVKDLSRLGPAAIPVLRKAMGRLEGEVRGRIDEAIRAIEAQDTLSRSLPSFRAVTLDHRNRPAKEALEEIARQSGITVQFEGDVGKEPLSLTLKDATPLEAFDEVCRKHGQLLPQIQGGEEGLSAAPRAGAGAAARIVFLAAPFVSFPSSYTRHYRTRVTEVSLTRVNNFQGTQSTGNLQIEIQWPPNVSPRSCLKFELTALTDDKGRSLLLEKKAEEGERVARSVRSGGLETATQETFEFKYPEADAAKIASLEGHFVLAFAKETRTLVFEKPGESKGKSLDLHGLKVTLDDYQEKGTELVVKISASGRYAGSGDALKLDRFADFAGMNLPFSYEDIQPVTVSGAPLSQNGMSSSGGDDSCTITLTFGSEKPQSLRELRIPCVLAHHLDEVKFEFKDIALPK